MALISVVMPSYNHEKYLPYAIDSVLRQDFKDFELIIVDDASRDNSAKIIKDAQQKDQRIRPILHEQNKGFVNTYNDGIKAAKGEYVAFIDSDDLWMENKLSEQLKSLRANDGLVVWSEGEIIDENNEATGEKFTQIHGQKEKQKSGHILGSILKNNYILGSSLITAKKNLEKVLFRDGLKYLNDWLFFTELAGYYEYFFIDQPLTKYRIHSGSTNRNTLGYLKDHLKINKIFSGKYGKSVSKEIRSAWYAQIATLYEKLGSRLHVDFYILKRFLTDRGDDDVRFNFYLCLKNRHHLLYKIIRKLGFLSEFRNE